MRVLVLASCLAAVVWPAGMRSWQAMTAAPAAAAGKCSDRPDCIEVPPECPGSPRCP